MDIKSRISPLAATAICLNTMIGAGLFINPGPLTAFAGPLGFMGYACSAVLLIPLLLCVANLAEHNPVSGGLYVYSKMYIHPFAGFLSGWGYFIGKTTSAAVLLHSFVLFSQSKFPSLALIPTIYCDYALIFLLIGINIIGMHVGGSLQQFFSILKLLPIMFGIVMGFIGFKPHAFFVMAQDIHGIIPAIPIAIFASVGFEIICSVGHMVENPKRNIKRILFRTLAKDRHIL
jgi:APA family basic amino acid/polyamine antiporter